MIQIKNWLSFKKFIDDKSLSIQFIEFEEMYHIYAFDNIFSLQYIMDKYSSDTTDLIDFETNYKNQANKKLEEPKDSDGTPLTRTKITQSGWIYHLHSIEFEVSKLNSVIEKKSDNTDWNFTNFYFYELIDNVETLMVNPSQEEITSKCIKTIVDWEPDFDYDVIGGFFKQQTLPTEDIRMWIVGVPDVPENYGGSKLFVSSLNLKFMGTDGIKVNAHAPKYLSYDPIYHTNKLRMIFRHPAGFTHKMCLILEIFKE